jgi:hypothetical protein
MRHPFVIAANVPCNGCTACCQQDLIMLHPECGDVKEEYDCYEQENPVTGKPGWALKRKPNGSCIYLGEGGCTIHGRAPAICREFDCRRLFLDLGDRASRRRAVAQGIVHKDVLKAGQDRLNTLPKSVLWKPGNNTEGD